MRIKFTPTRITVLLVAICLIVVFLLWLFYREEQPIPTLSPEVQKELGGEALMLVQAIDAEQNTTSFRANGVEVKRLKPDDFPIRASEIFRPIVPNFVFFGENLEMVIHCKVTNDKKFGRVERCFKLTRSPRTEHQDKTPEQKSPYTTSAEEEIPVLSPEAQEALGDESLVFALAIDGNRNITTFRAKGVQVQELNPEDFPLPAGKFFPTMAPTFSFFEGSPEEVVECVCRTVGGRERCRYTSYTHPSQLVPTIDLDADDSAGVSGNDFATSFTEGGGPVAIADIDVTVTDADDTNMESATITLTTRPDGEAETLALSTAGTTTATAAGIVATPYNATTGVLALSGSATKIDYQNVIRETVYNNTSDAPTTTARTATVLVNDGDTDSNAATTTTNVMPTNDAPTIMGTVAGQAINDTATVMPFTAVTIGDVDDPPQILSVSVASDDLAKGVFTPASLTATGFTDAGGGTYTFSGTATAATTAIGGLVFDPTDNRGAPGTMETTTFTITVNDGGATPTSDNTTTVVSMST